MAGHRTHSVNLYQCRPLHNHTLAVYLGFFVFLSQPIASFSFPAKLTFKKLQIFSIKIIRLRYISAFLSKYYWMQEQHVHWPYCIVRLSFERDLVTRWIFLFLNQLLPLVHTFNGTTAGLDYLEVSCNCPCNSALWAKGYKECRLSWLTNSASYTIWARLRGGGRRCGVSAMSTAVHRSPSKLWRSNSIFNLCFGQSASIRTAYPLGGKRYTFLLYWL
jgi:hypothetical protein